MAEPVLFVVPARAGSRRLPLKNFRLLQGIPLFAWSIWFAKAALPGSRILLSTDYEPLLKLRHQISNLEVVSRSPAVSTSEASTEDWLRNLLEEHNPNEKIIALLQPTSPFRFTGTFDTLLQLQREAPLTTHYSGTGLTPNGNLYLFTADTVLGGGFLTQGDAEAVPPTYDWENVDIDDGQDWHAAEEWLTNEVIQKIVEKMSKSEVGRKFEGLTL